MPFFDGVVQQAWSSQDLTDVRFSRKCTHTWPFTQNYLHPQLPYKLSSVVDFLVKFKQHNYRQMIIIKSISTLAQFETFARSKADLGTRDDIIYFWIMLLNQSTEFLWIWCNPPNPKREFLEANRWIDRLGLDREGDLSSLCTDIGRNRTSCLSWVAAFQNAISRNLEWWFKWWSGWRNG